MKCDNCGKDFPKELLWTGGDPTEHLCDECLDAKLDEQLECLKKFPLRIDDLDFE